MGFPFKDAIHDCEQMQHVIEVILDEAKTALLGVDQGRVLGEAFNALQTAINELETCRDGLARRGGESESMTSGN